MSVTQYLEIFKQASQGSFENSYINPLKGKPLPKWEIRQEVIDECGTYDVDLFNHNNWDKVIAPTYGITSSNICFTYSRHLLGIKWKFTYNKKDVENFDPVYGIWNHESNFKLVVGGQIIDRISFFLYPILHKLSNSSNYKLEVQYLPESEDVTFIIPMMFDFVQNDNTFPLLFYHLIEVECNLYKTNQFLHAKAKKFSVYLHFPTTQNKLDVLIMKLKDWFIYMM